MEWYFYKNRVILRDVESFDLEQTFECGQCFRWRRLESGNWLGIVRGLVVEAEKKGDDIIFHNMSPTDFTEVWHDYFDLGRDYGTLQRKLAENDPIMEKAIEFAPGLRLLRQDFMKLSYLLSSRRTITYRGSGGLFSAWLRITESRWNTRDRSCIPSRNQMSSVSFLKNPLNA